VDLRWDDSSIKIFIWDNLGNKQVARLPPWEL
jgi:hypothetical protein